MKVRRLFSSPAIRIRTLTWSGDQPIAARQPAAPHIVYPQCGSFELESRGTVTIAEANSALLLGPGDCLVAQPASGGEVRCLILTPAPAIISEIAPPAKIVAAPLGFAALRTILDPRAQVLSALLAHSLGSGAIEPLEAEGLALTLIQRTLGMRTSRDPQGTFGNGKLVDRAKAILQSDLSRRWTLSDIAAQVGVSPVYLTQSFRKVEGMPLYRYQLRLRLFRALDLLPQARDLTALALDLGFTSHSHFSAAFRQAYGRSPSEFRESVERCEAKNH